MKLRRRLARSSQVAQLAWFWMSSRRVRRRWRAMEEEDGFDATHGTETTGQHLRLNYGATPVRTFRRIMAAVPPPFDHAVFVDLGSGKGRALLMASEYPFKKLIGVEHSPQLHAVADRNLAKHAQRAGETDRFELRCQDAADYARRSWPPNANVLLFLYCPFPSIVLQEVCDAIRRHADAWRQRITIAFVNPNENMRRVLRSWPGLRSVARFEPDDPSLAAYESFEIFSTE